MTDARWQPEGPVKAGENPGQDPAVQAAVAKIKADNAAAKAARRSK